MQAYLLIRPIHGALRRHGTSIKQSPDMRAWLAYNWPHSSSFCCVELCRCVVRACTDAAVIHEHIDPHQYRMNTEASVVGFGRLCRISRLVNM